MRLCEALPQLFRSLRPQGGGAVRVHPRLVVGITAVMRTLQNAGRDRLVAVLLASKARRSPCLRGLRPAPHPTRVHGRAQGVTPSTQVVLVQDLCSAWAVSVTVSRLGKSLTRAAQRGYVCEHRSCACPWMSPAMVCMPTDVRIITAHVYSLTPPVSAAAAELGAMIGVNHTVLAVAVRVRGMPATQCSVRFAQ